MEREILQLLMQTPGNRYSYKEIGRAIDRKRFRQDARWARPVLEKLVMEKYIRSDENSLYYFPKPEKKNKQERQETPEGAQPGQTIDLPDETE
jgi:hypothetical protein